MAEVESTNEPISAEAETIPQAEPAEPPEPPAVEPPKRGRGRPAGSKDKAPRVTKPKVRVEPIPQPEPQPEKARKPAPPPVEEERPPVARARTPSPEPPSPRTLFHQTSAHLLSLRDVMNSQKRAQAAERYTARLHDLPVV